MSNTPQDKSVQKITHKIIIDADESLSEVEHRLQFIMNTLCTPADWIEDDAATGLFYTLDSIAKRINGIRSTAMAEVRA